MNQVCGTGVGELLQGLSSRIVPWIAATGAFVGALRASRSVAGSGCPLDSLTCMRGAGFYSLGFALQSCENERDVFYSLVDGFQVAELSSRQPPYELLVDRPTMLSSRRSSKLV